MAQCIYEQIELMYGYNKLYNYSSRFDFMRHIRHLADNNWKNASDDEEGEDSEQMDATSGKVHSSHRGRRRRSGHGGKSVPKKDENAMDVDRMNYRPGRHYKDQVNWCEWKVL